MHRAVRPCLQQKQHDLRQYLQVTMCWRGDHQCNGIENQTADNERINILQELMREGKCPCMCSEVYDPVCGKDGETYENICEAECAGVVRFAYKIHITETKEAR